MDREGTIEIHWRERNCDFIAAFWSNGEELGEGKGLSLHQAIEEAADEVFLRRRLLRLVTGD